MISKVMYYVMLVGKRSTSTLQLYIVVIKFWKRLNYITNISFIITFSTCFTIYLKCYYSVDLYFFHIIRWYVLFFFFFCITKHALPSIFYLQTYDWFVTKVINYENCNWNDATSSSVKKQLSIMRLPHLSYPLCMLLNNYNIWIYMQSLCLYFCMISWTYTEAIF